MQFDSASENKVDSLAFIAYLIEMRIFHVVKLRYLIIGNTHENIDQLLYMYFSVITGIFEDLCVFPDAYSRYVKGFDPSNLKDLMQVKNWKPNKSLYLQKKL